MLRGQVGLSRVQWRVFREGGEGWAVERCLLPPSKLVSMDSLPFPAPEGFFSHHLPLGCPAPSVARGLGAPGCWTLCSFWGGSWQNGSLRADAYLVAEDAACWAFGCLTFRKGLEIKKIRLGLLVLGQFLFAGKTLSESPALFTQSCFLLTPHLSSFWLTSDSCPSSFLTPVRLCFLCI